MLTVEELKDIVQVRIDKINQRHPYPNTKRFRENSYEKWACQEVLREIKISEDLPFISTSKDILYGLKHKMDSAPGTITCFSVGADLIDELIELEEKEAKR